MSIQAKLHVDGNVYNIKQFHYGIVQQTDISGMPCTRPQQTGIHLSIDLVKDELFDEWSIAEKMTKQIEIHMAHTILGQGRTRILKCYDCYLLNFATDYMAYSNESATYSLYITSGGIEPSWSTGVYSENWRVTFPSDEEPTVIEEQEEPEVVSCRYTDMDGVEIDELYEDTLILEVHTKNCVGKFINIDLSDDEYDFSYQGKYLENDLLEGLKITSDVQKVTLEIFEE